MKIEVEPQQNFRNRQLRLSCRSRSGYSWRAIKCLAIDSMITRLWESFRWRETRGLLGVHYRGRWRQQKSKTCAAEAAVVEEIEIIAVSSLSQAVAFLTGDLDRTPPRIDEYFENFSKYDLDYVDVRGQEMAKRALTIAAAGAHNLLMLSPPGREEPEDIPRKRSDDPAITRKTPNGRRLADFGRKDRDVERTLEPILRYWMVRPVLPVRQFRAELAVGQHTRPSQCLAVSYESTSTLFVDGILSLISVKGSAIHD